MTAGYTKFLSHADAFFRRSGRKPHSGDRADPSPTCPRSLPHRPAGITVTSLVLFYLFYIFLHKL